MFFTRCWGRFKKVSEWILRYFAIFIVVSYKSVLKGLFGVAAGCRFYPTCGDYALQIYGEKPFLEATRRVVHRLLKCHFLGPVCFPEGCFPTLNSKRKRVS